MDFEYVAQFPDRRSFCAADISACRSRRSESVIDSINVIVWFGWSGVISTYYLHHGGYVFGSVGLFVCLCTRLLKKLWTDFDKICWRGQGGGQGTADSILVMFWITIWLQDFFEGFLPHVISALCLTLLIIRPNFENRTMLPNKSDQLTHISQLHSTLLKVTKGHDRGAESQTVWLSCCIWFLNSL